MSKQAVTAWKSADVLLDGTIICVLCETQVEVSRDFKKNTRNNSTQIHHELNQRQR